MTIFNRRSNNTPPDYDLYESLLEPARFQPNTFLFINEETDESFHPETAEIARQYIEQERREREEAFEKRPPFDPTETIKCFETCYKGMIRYCAYGYLRKDGGWFDGTTPYIKIIFKNVSEFEREKGFALRIRRNSEGEMISSCRYLYDELYRKDHCSIS